MSNVSTVNQQRAGFLIYFHSHRSGSDEQPRTVTAVTSAAQKMDVKNKMNTKRDAIECVFFISYRIFCCFFFFSALAFGFAFMWRQYIYLYILGVLSLVHTSNPYPLGNEPWSTQSDHIQYTPVSGRYIQCSHDKQRKSTSQFSNARLRKR